MKSETKEIITKTETIEKKGSRRNKITELSNGEFSITRVMMIVTLILAALLIVIGVVSSLVWNKTLPDNIYNYTLGLAGGGILQYIGTKVKNVIEQKNGITTTSPVTTSTTTTKVGVKK